MFRIGIIILCALVIAGASLFGLFYDPGHPWMDRKRKLGVTVLCIAGVVELAAILIGQI